MKRYAGITKSRVLRTASAVAALAALTFAGGASAGVSQSGEAKSMNRVGHVDLQGRPAYQPNVIAYPDGRTIAFAGTHGGTAPNPLKAGSPVENNGTMIIDVTDPSNPKELYHIPVAVAGGQAQMARMCLGSDLPGGTPGTVYLMRNLQTNNLNFSGYEVWDVTNPSAPSAAPISEIRHIRSTHKLWWECNTGVAYLPGSKDASFGLPLWRTSQSMVIVDWANPAAPPVYLRTDGPPGAQPAAVSQTAHSPNSLHGAISAHEHPNAAGGLTGYLPTPGDNIIGNRVYAAWGVGDDGILQILDRKKLLPSLSNGRGGTYAGPADLPTDADLDVAQAGRLDMSPDQGGHTSLPVFGLEPPSYQSYTQFKRRDIVVLSSEATADRCDEPPHWAFIVDVTVENSKTRPPATRAALEPNPYQGPMVLSTLSVDPRDGEKYPRGNYCTRGARFGVHSSEENFRNPFYGKLTVIAWFTGGVRVWDIREPQAPVLVAFYVPEGVPPPDDPDGGYMTNNVEVDNRGYIYATDRNGFGLDILQLMPPASHIISGK